MYQRWPGNCYFVHQMIDIKMWRISCVEFQREFFIDETIMFKIILMSLQFMWKIWVEDIRAQDIRAHSSILEYNKSGFGFTVEKIFRNLYDYKIKKYFFIFFA